jgi:hypothetical protein
VKKVTPDKWGVGNGRSFPRGYFFGVGNPEVFTEKNISFFLAFLAEEHYMKGIVILMFGIKAVNGKSTAQAVRAALHIANSGGNHLA